MSILSRTGLNASRGVLAAAGRQQVRFAGNANIVNHTIPSNVTNKPLLAAKIITFFVFGFGTPFYAVHYHLNK